MSADDRVAVKTYVPRNQKRTWVSHAEDLDMTQSEFVRTMVQAGRSDIGIPGSTGHDGMIPDDSTDNEAGSNPSSDGSPGFEDRIRTILDRRGALDWDELVDALVDDVESELDEALQELQANGDVVHSGRTGGYILTTDE